MFNVLLAEPHLRFWVHARPLVGHMAAYLASGILGVVAFA